MPSGHFDLVIVGDSLAARMAAALLAKHGRRLLRFPLPAPRETWWHSSLFVDRLLAALGGRACFATCRPVQVISARARVTLHPDVPLADELGREFGTGAAAVGQLLGQLEQLARPLEEALWEHGGLPKAEFADRARWRWLTLRRKLPLAALGAPLTERVNVLAEAPRDWARTLFQGLSLRPLEELSVADGALLWSGVRHPEGIAADDLVALLNKRYEQFHGTEADPDALESLEYGGGQWNGSLRGSRFQAQQLLIAGTAGRLPKGLQAGPHIAATPRLYATTDLGNRVSTLLAPRVIVGGDLPLRLTLSSDANGRCAWIGSSRQGDEALIRRQLAPVLPFAHYDLQAFDPPDAASPPAAATLFACPLEHGSHAWRADERELLPHLGLHGAALIAWSLVRRIAPDVMPKSGAA